MKETADSRLLTTTKAHWIPLIETLNIILNQKLGEVGAVDEQGPNLLSLKVLKILLFFELVFFMISLFSSKCLNSEYTAAEISYGKESVDDDKESSHDGITVTTKGYGEDLDKHEEINYNEIRSRLRYLESELRTTMQSVRSKRVNSISEEVHSLVSLTSTLVIYFICGGAHFELVQSYLMN